MQRHPSSAESALSHLLELYAESASPHMGEGVALALAESAGLWGRDEVMQALNFLLGIGFVARDGAVRGLMLQSGMGKAHNSSSDAKVGGCGDGVMQVLNFLLGVGFVARDGAARGLMLQSGVSECGS